MGKGFSEEEVDQHRQRLLTPKMMDLFAVICIRTSHYVAFVKAGREKDSEWVFFDSMADRQGDQQGYYIPQVTHLKDFRRWVDVDHIKARIEGKQLTEIIERLLGDAYIYMYSDSEQHNQFYL
ncbi:ubiquitin carboxyl-terminal hydrolase CYLD-like [Patiria miniata]|uniref:USP domain-containing protein n=1 Tax=Patiria miniata TaxID=46514 RepID=A0A914ASP9_PATMI|nr:ubiquitin carboxyl-terminal hydrolase CYLD-like [Patiria miniata]